MKTHNFLGQYVVLILSNMLLEYHDVFLDMHESSHVIMVIMSLWLSGKMINQNHVS